MGFEVLLRGQKVHVVDIVVNKEEMEHMLSYACNRVSRCVN